MASEFTRKIQRIKDILTFNSILADDGDILLTKSGEVYTQVNGKVKQLSNPNYGAGNVNKILAVSDTGEVVPIQMPGTGDILGKDNTFSGNNTYSKAINALGGINGALNARTLTFTDFADVAKNAQKYTGYNSIFGLQIDNSPYGNQYHIWGIMNVVIRPEQGIGYSGYIELNDYNSNDFWKISFNNGVLENWLKIASDANVVHNTGNETASGDKTFNGQTTLLNGNFGLRVTNSGIVKTTDAGKTWVAL